MTNFIIAIGEWLCQWRQATLASASLPITYTTFISISIIIYSVNTGYSARMLDTGTGNVTLSGYSSGGSSNPTRVIAVGV